MKKVLYVCGSHSTGKSTLLDDVEKLLKVRKINYYRNISPRLLVPRELLYTTVNDLAQYRITLSVLGNIMENYHSVDIIMTDRFLADNLVYAMSSPEISPHLITVHKQMFDYFMKEWKVVVLYLPIEFSLDPDGIHPLDEQYRGKIDFELRKLLGQDSYYPISGPHEKRLQQVRLILKDEFKLEV